MITALADAQRRGAKVVHINPLIEGATNGTIVPHEIDQMMMAKVTQTSSLNLQVRPGGDLALMRGIAKRLFEMDQTDPEALDHAYLETYTHDYAAYRELVEATPWEDIVAQSGVSRGQIMQLTNLYRESGKTVISWCLGVTQHEHGVDAVREIVNVLMLRGNMGKGGVGPSPVRGHSNVQGNRTCGIDHRPTQDFLDTLDRVCGITSPGSTGWTRSAPSRPCRRAGSGSSCPWAGTSCAPCRTRTTRSGPCASWTSTSRSAPSSTAATSSSGGPR